MPHGHFHHFLLKVYCIAAIIATIFDIPCCNPTSMVYRTGYHPHRKSPRGCVSGGFLCPVWTLSSFGLLIVYRISVGFASISESESLIPGSQTSAPLLYLYSAFLAAIRHPCYTVQATTPIQVEKGGVLSERYLIVFYLRSGKCSRILHLQMAGRQDVTGSQPQA